MHDRTPHASRFRWPAACAVVVLAIAGPALALVATKWPTAADGLAFRAPELYIANVYQPLGALPAAIQAARAADLAALGVASDAGFYDLRGARWGTLIASRPLVPGTGKGNSLTWSGVGLAPPADEEAYRAAVWTALRGFLAAHRAQLRIDASELGEPRISVHDGGRLVQVWAGRVVGGVPVRDSFITGVLNGGNLVLLGARNWGDVLTAAQPVVDATLAEEIVGAHARGALSVSGSWRPTELALVPVAAGADLAGVAVGQGYGHRLAWVVSVKLAGHPGTWQGLVDATTGELLSFADENRYFDRKVGGGAYPVSNDGKLPDGVEQPGFPMPFADIVQPFGTSTTSSSAGLVDGASGVLRTTLSGPYVRISDNCGPIDEEAVCGDLDLGFGPGTDCDVPPGHSPGDTHASRTGFYEVNRLTQGARAQLPDNEWLGRQITANMNIDDVCNAFWDGQTINFFKSGSASLLTGGTIDCANTGEIPAVFDHEWGHGLDDNNTNPDISAPGEAIADIYGILKVVDSCMGRGFAVGATDCLGGGYGDSCLGCSGVRELDYDKHASHQPHDIDWILSANPGPGGGCVGVASTSAQFGPCNQETHCEGTVPAETGWDLFARDLQSAPASLDSNTALEVATRLFYQGFGPVANWYQCAPSSVAIAGCNADGGYLNLLAADDDNGDLTDGTPHMTALFGAFSRHQIACITPAAVDSGCAGGPATPPGVTASALPNAAQLSWGAVAGASEYWVFRTEGVKGCGFGKVKIGETTATSYTDSGLLDGFTYYYVVIPIGAGDACLGPASACTSVVPLASAPQPEALLAFREVTPEFLILSGDGDPFLDNCEIARFRLVVENAGTVDLANVQLVSVTSPSHPGIEVLTPLPAPLAGTLAGNACGSPASSALATFDLVPHGLAFEDTLELRFEVRASSSLGPVTLAGTATVGPAESNFEHVASVTFDFESGYEGWNVVSGTFTRESPGANGSSTHLASSSLTPGQCDEVSSPQLRLSPSSTLSLYEQFDTEPGNPAQGDFDRANVGVLDIETGMRTTVSPDGGRAYTASGSNGACVTQGKPGWNGAGPGFLESTWSAAALGAAEHSGRRVRIDVAYGTDPLVEGLGLQFDQVTLTDVDLQRPDGIADACGATPRILLNGDAATTAENAAVTVAVLVNDFTTSPPLAVVGVTQPANGSAANNGDGTVTYTPASHFTGSDTFTYTARDASGAQATATVVVQVTGAPTPPGCSEPGPVILSDGAGDSLDGLDAHDVRSFSLSQPAALGGGMFVFTLKVASLATVPPDSTWPVIFRTPDGVDRFAKMATSPTGAVSFAYGTGTSTGVAGTPADPASSFSPDGTIRIVVPASVLGNPQPGEQIQQFLTRIAVQIPGAGSITPDNMPDGLARTGSYTVANCVPETPVAVDDSASTELNAPVTIAVLANDSDPNGDPLTVGGLTQPAHGAAAINPDQSVTYTPNLGFLGDDAFTYRACDPDNDCDGATVTVTVRCPEQAGGGFSDDLEPAPEPGWTFQTAANSSPVSLTWRAITDPFAHSASTSFTSDAIGVDLKDDRLIAPPQDLSATSHLTFWHRFNFEGGFDGGVLEVSRDGGATWVDVQAGGGTYVVGGYNGEIATGAGSPIAGRFAWTGLSAFADAMQRVDVDLGAFAGHAVLVRWRLATDPVALGALPGIGWWIDDIAFSDTTITPATCPLPPAAVDDTASTNEDTPVVIDVLANDVDPNADPLTVTAVSDPPHGGAVINADQTITYTPDSDFSGTDTFTYTVSDGALTDTATVTVGVVEVDNGRTRANGSGWIPDGSNKAHFSFDARTSATPRGRLEYNAKGSSFKIKGTVSTLTFPTFTSALLSGSCELANGSPCTFTARVEDNAEEGEGADRFEITVKNTLGATVHAKAGTLGGGNVSVR